MKLSAEDRKLLERIPIDVLVQHSKRIREMGALMRRIENGKKSIAEWEAKIARAEADLKVLKKWE